MTSRAPITEIQRMGRAKIMREINDRLVSEDTVVEKKKASLGLQEWGIEYGPSHSE